MNRSIVGKASQKIKSMVREGATVAVLGLSYKPHSHVTDESQGLFIAEHLSKSGFRVVAYDPMSSKMELGDILGRIVVLDSLKECLNQAEAVLVTTPDPAFLSLRAEDFENSWQDVLVVDFWRILETELSGQPRIKYVAFGKSSNDTLNSKRLKAIWKGESERVVGLGKL